MKNMKLTREGIDLVLRREIRIEEKVVKRTGIISDVKQSTCLIIHSKRMMDMKAYIRKKETENTKESINRDPEDTRRMMTLEMQ